MSRCAWPRLPAHAAGQRIGLLGGSFDPAHEGHRHISIKALRRLGLDQVWWLVTPGNPLKDVSGLAALDARLARARLVARHPRIRVTGFEEEAGTRYSADTLERLTARASRVRFVWLMGADNLAQFHLWERWPDIARTMPIAVIDRPGATLRALASPAAAAMARHRLDRADAPRLAAMEPPSWVFLFGPRSSESSTRIRQSSGHDATV
ncbi:MAG: nicotinate-nucleotide adenylyltransferase [Pseudomonadota bacterium]